MMVLFTCNYKISYKQGSDKEPFRHIHTLPLKTMIYVLHRGKSYEVLSDER